MKSFSGVRAWMLISLFIFSEQSFASWVDPQLESWLKSEDQSNGLIDPTQTVILFLKAPKYQDHTGLSREQAIIEEKTFQYSFLKGESNEISNLLSSTTSVDYLWSSNAMVAEVDKAGLKKLKKHPSVEAIVFNRIITLDDPKELRGKRGVIKSDEAKMTYGLQLIHADAAWKEGITGEGVKIGVIDTGVDETHPDLKGKVILQKDFTKEANNKDGEGHGTHVCGTIAGGDTSGTHIGVAPGAKIIMAKALDSKGSGSLATLLKAMEFMLDPDGDPSTNDAPRLVSNSWGAPFQFIYGFRNVVRAWRRFGIFPNFAAGNSGPWPLTANAPGSYPFSFAVGAVGEDMNITSFSSRGPTIWWKTWHPILTTKPDISAPGLDVKSSVPGGGYEYMSGTSMATPHIAGVAALAWQANPNLTADDMIEILDESTLDRGGKAKDNRFGNGVVQVDKVIAKAKSWKVSAPSSFQDRDPSLWEWDTP